MDFWNRHPADPRSSALVERLPWRQRRAAGRLRRPRGQLSLVGTVLALVVLTWASASPLTAQSAHAAALVRHAVSPGGATTLPSAATGAPSGRVVQTANCLQAPPQSVKDRATYTPAELARYGLPPRTPGEPFAKWASIVRSAGQRVCTSIVSADSYAEHNSYNWDGNTADQAVSGQVYTEADLDYYVSCISSSPPPDGNPATYAAWVGLGGVLGSGILVQTGTVGWQTFNSQNGWQNTYWAWVENTGASDPNAIYEFPVSCGNHMYVKAWDSGSTGCMYIERLNDGKNSGTQCYGPRSDEKTGEAIVEYNYSEPDFARYGSETFYGVGITDSCNCGYNGYKAMSSLPHDYYNLYECQPLVDFPNCKYFGDQLAWTGPIQNDPGDVPYDQYAVNWQNYH